jgi:hypothetical protein
MPSRRPKHRRSSFPLFVIQEPAVSAGILDIDRIVENDSDFPGTKEGKNVQGIISEIAKEGSREDIVDQKMTLMSLPEEIIHKILHYLVVPDLVAVMLTSKQMARIGQDSELMYSCYMDVYLSPVFVSEDEEVRKLKAPPVVPKSIVFEAWRLLCSITKTLIETGSVNTVRNQTVNIFEKMVEYHPQTFYRCPLSIQELSHLLELNPPFVRILSVLPEKKVKKLIEYWTKLPQKPKSNYSSLLLHCLQIRGNFREKPPNLAKFIFKCVRSRENPATIRKLLKILRDFNLLKQFSGEILANLQSILINNNSKKSLRLLKFIGSLK